MEVNTYTVIEHLKHLRDKNIRGAQLHAEEAARLAEERQEYLDQSDLLRHQAALQQEAIDRLIA